MKLAALILAIWTAEGGYHTKYPFGIRSVDTHGDVKAARRICENTVRNSWARWDGRGCFIIHLASTYCPEKSDRVGHYRWKRNVVKLMHHQPCDCDKSKGLQ